MKKIIDVFAGVGGLSLGAARAGFEVCAAVEIDRFALETHKKNFPNTKHIDRDVATLSGKELLALADIELGKLDGLIGGPPCQGFSPIGVGDLNDPRSKLFGHFFRLIAETSPTFFVAENVPGILNAKYDDIRNEAFAKLNGRYTLLKPIRIKASEYGAPTIRTRIFFIGYDPQKIQNLAPENFLPKDVQQVRVKDALEGLPVEIDPSWKSEESGWRPYGVMKDTDFSKSIRERIPAKTGEPESLKRYKEMKEVSGCMGTLHSKKVEDRYKALKVGKQDPISKSSRLNPDGFCPTLRAGTASDKGSYQAVRPIHFTEPRVITPREAARLQGFPDWFVLHRTKWHSFRQIGNSVSPIVSEYLLKTIYKFIK